MKSITVETDIGRRETDTQGSPVGVVRMDPEKSYLGVGELLQKYINDHDESAWESIKAKIDYTFKNIDLALSPLETETGFSREIRTRLDKGQKLLFKPNLVSINSIEPITHGVGSGNTACTDWTFVAAVMRWFHDKLDLGYYQMCLGEAATTMSGAASLYTRLKGDQSVVTTEAAIEGRSGDFYGGWGFYFIRKYLSGIRPVQGDDDPMKGYEESVAGTYLPPGKVKDKLMVYDLNRIGDDTERGRDVAVADGVNFKSIILHKAIVGGNPDDPDDMKNYPGCVLINLPKLKVHVQALLTNVIKNLGIGLYPMQATRSDRCRWEYARPHTPIPGMKAGIPHQVWVPELDPATCLPRRDAKGHYVVNKTGGLTATMIDIIKAVVDQDVYLLNIVDAIEATNIDHTGSRMGLRQSEGLIFAGVDPVATDQLCARYLFSNVPLKEAFEAGLDDGSGGCFPQAVPIPMVEDNHIITGKGYDCPLARDIVNRQAEERGLGTRTYYALGRDVTTDSPLASFAGRLGRIQNDRFTSIITSNLYLAVAKMPWDLQQTFFHYLEAVDQLTGSELKKEFLEEFDENGDGIVSYEEKGKKGIYGPGLVMGGITVSKMGDEELEHLRVAFATMVSHIKYTLPEWNSEGHDFAREHFFGAVAVTAYMLSLAEVEMPDNFTPGLTWGRGKWPGFQQAFYARISQAVYGQGYPFKIGFPSMYYSAFRYTDITQNERRYSGPHRTLPDEEAADKYVKDVLNGKAEPLDFTFFVPPGYGRIMENNTPNVEETSDPARIFTVSFRKGEAVWPDLKITDIQTDLI